MDKYKELILLISEKVSNEKDKKYKRKHHASATTNLQPNKGLYQTTQCQCFCTPYAYGG